MAKKWKEVIQDPRFPKDPDKALEVREEYFNNVVAPKVSLGERDDARQEFFSYTEEVTPQLQQSTIIDTVKNAFQESDLGKSFMSGWEHSVSSLAFADKKPKEYQYKNTLESLTGQFATALGDTPFMVAGGILGAEGGPVTIAGGAMALPSGMRKYYLDQLENGEIGSFNEFVDRFSKTMNETIKGWNIGATTGRVAMSKAPGVLKPVLEGASMTGTAAAQEGRVPQMQEFIEGTMLAGAIRASGIPANKIRKHILERGKIPKELKAELPEEMQVKLEKEPHLIDQLTEIYEKQEALAKRRNPGWLDEYTSKIDQIESVSHPKQEIIRKPMTPEQAFVAERLIDTYNVKEITPYNQPILKLVLGGDRELAPLGDTTKIVKQRKLGEKKTPTVPVFEAEAEAIRRLGDVRIKKDMSPSQFKEAIQKGEKVFDYGRLEKFYDTPIRTFEELGTDIKHIFYDNVVYANSNSVRASQALKDQVKLVKKSLSSKEQYNVNVHAIAQQEIGYATLKEMGITDIPKSLTPKEARAYDFLRGQYDKFYTEVNNARIISGKEPFTKRENYTTFMRKIEFLDQSGVSPVNVKLGEQGWNNPNLEKYAHPRSTGFGFSKQRTKNRIPIELDSFEVLTRYGETANRHIHMSPVIAKGRELLNTLPTKDGGKFRLAEKNPVVYKTLTEWLDYVSGKRDYTRLPTFVEKGVLRATRNIAGAYLSGTFRTLAIQPSAFAGTLSLLGSKYSRKGVVDNFSSKMRQFATEQSRVLKGREYDVSASLAEHGLIGDWNTLQTKATNLGLLPLKVLDLETARATWLGAYRQGKNALKLNDIKAIEYADDIVTRTQGSAFKHDTSRAQRTTVGKAMHVFQTFSINQWGMIWKDILGKGTNKIPRSESLKRSMRFIAASTALNMFYEDVLNMYSPFPSPIRAFKEEIDQGNGLPSASKEAALELMTWMPVISSVRFGSTPLGATADFIGKAAKKAAYGRGETGEIIGTALGIPGTRQFYKLKRNREK